MMNHVIEDERSERGCAWQSEHHLATALERPWRQHLGIARCGDAGAGGRNILVELCHQVGDPRGSFRPSVAGRFDVEHGVLQDRIDPVRNVGDVPGELTHAERLVVWLPGELSLRRTLEEAPGGSHLVVEFRKQRVSYRHPLKNMSADWAVQAVKKRTGRTEPIRFPYRLAVGA
jgi:hypothetical protein